MAVAEHFNIKSVFIPGIATGFCSGVARTAGLCGALNGGILSLGLVNGRRKPHADVDLFYDQVEDLIREFESSFGSTNCLTLTGCHLGTLEGQEKYHETGQLSNCITYVVAVTSKVLELTRNISEKNR